MRTAIAFVALLGGCAATRSPVQGARAVELYAAGATYEEVAAKLAVDHDTARELIRIGIVDLNRRLYRTR